MNRLANEKSPYLLQHKNNPVDWYPLGPAALDKAKKENKPLFISIGYSTCHWWHVRNLPGVKALKFLDLQIYFSNIIKKIL